MKKEIVKTTQEVENLKRVPMAVDISETDEAYLLTAEIPGASRESVTIELEQDELTIEARADFASLGTPVFQEFESRLYSRAFHVGRLVDREKIKARVENGLLFLELGKSSDVKPQRIEILSQ